MKLGNYSICDKATVHLKFKDNTKRKGKIHSGDILLTSDGWNKGVQINNIEWLPPKPIEVIFNPPATIVFREDGSKTVVKAQEISPQTNFRIAENTMENVAHNIGEFSKLINSPIETEIFDKEKGLAMCFAKKMMGNNGSYYDMFKEWC